MPYGMWGLFEGDFADMCDGSGGSRVHKPGSDDPHRREWKFVSGSLTIIQYSFCKSCPDSFAFEVFCLYEKLIVCKS